MIRSIQIGREYWYMGLTVKVLEVRPKTFGRAGDQAVLEVLGSYLSSELLSCNCKEPYDQSCCP